MDKYKQAFWILTGGMAMFFNFTLLPLCWVFFRFGKESGLVAALCLTLLALLVARLLLRHLAGDGHYRTETHMLISVGWFLVRYLNLVGLTAVVFVWIVKRLVFPGTHVYNTGKRKDGGFRKAGLWAASIMLVGNALVVPSAVSVGVLGFDAKADSALGLALACELAFVTIALLPALTSHSGFAALVERPFAAFYRNVLEPIVALCSIARATFHFDEDKDDSA